MSNLAKDGKARFIIVLEVLGVFLMGLFVGAYVVPQLKSIFAPHPWSLYSPQAELGSIVIEFLKTTDVPNGGWDGTVDVKEVYDHKLGGKVVIVRYTTVNGGHPGFFLEAIEHHTAVITLNLRGEVVSAFCVWGSFHDGKIWDLLNQRWIQQDIISEQQAIQMGKHFLDGINYMTGKVLFTKLEEKAPNFYWHDLAELENQIYKDLDFVGLSDLNKHTDQVISLKFG